VLVHCNTVAEAAQIARELDLTLATVPDHVDSIGQILQQSTILEEADAACSSLLGRVTEACPHIDGKAAQKFGTLFRVADFREICAGQLVRDVDLMRVLQHVAAASDAKRHLTATRVQEAVSLVLKLLETRSHMSPPPPPTQDFEGVYDTTSEAECSDVSLPSSATSHCVTQQLGFADCAALPGAPATSRSTSHIQEHQPRVSPKGPRFRKEMTANKSCNFHYKFFCKNHIFDSGQASASSGP
jgi:hypothetical protein